MENLDDIPLESERMFNANQLQTVYKMQLNPSKNMKEDKGLPFVDFSQGLQPIHSHINIGNTKSKYQNESQAATFKKEFYVSTLNND